MSRYSDCSDLMDPPGPIDSATDAEIVMRWRRILGLPDNQQLPGCANLHCTHCSPIAQRFTDSTVDWKPEQRSLFLSAQAFIYESYWFFPSYLERLRGDWWFFRSIANSEPPVDLPWLPEFAAKLADRYYGWLLAEVMEYLVVTDAFYSALVANHDRTGRPHGGPPHLA